MAASEETPPRRTSKPRARSKNPRRRSRSRCKPSDPEGSRPSDRYNYNERHHHRLERRGALDAAVDFCQPSLKDEGSSSHSSTTQEEEEAPPVTKATETRRGRRHRSKEPAKQGSNGDTESEEPPRRRTSEEPRRRASEAAPRRRTSEEPRRRTSEATPRRRTSDRTPPRRRSKSTCRSSGDRSPGDHRRRPSDRRGEAALSPLRKASGHHHRHEDSPKKQHRRSPKISPSTKKKISSRSKHTSASPPRGALRGKAPRIVSGGMIRIEVLRGRNLIAKDRNLVGLRTTSDPYVCILWKDSSSNTWTSQFQTATRLKTLSPEFDESFSIPLGSHAMTELLTTSRRGEVNLEFQLFDYDVIGDDDFMGGFACAAGTVVAASGQSVEPVWYSLESKSQSDPGLTCWNAQGKLQVKIWAEAAWLPELERGDQLLLPDTRAASTASRVHVEILQGQHLIAKDRNLVGRRTTSDPYVRVFWHGHGGWDEKFQTQTIMKTLDPEFDEKFSFELESSNLTDLLASDSRDTIEFLLFDHDDIGDDDYMGGMVVPAADLVKGADHAVPRWYNLQCNAHSDKELKCRNARGQLQVKLWIETDVEREATKDQVPPKDDLELELFYTENNSNTHRSDNHYNPEEPGDEVTVDASLVVVNENGHIAWEECAYFAQPVTRAFTFEEKMVKMRLDRLPDDIVAVYYIVHVPDPDKSLDDVSQLQVRLLEGDKGLCRFVLPSRGCHSDSSSSSCSKAPPTTAQVVLRLHRLEWGQWCLVPIAKSYPRSRDFGTLLPQIKSLTRDLVPSVDVIPHERCALMRPGTSTRILDYSQYGEEFPDVLTWSVQWADGEARVTAWLLDVDQRPIGSVSDQRPSMGGVQYSQKEADFQSFSLSLYEIPSRIEYVAIAVVPTHYQPTPPKDSSLNLGCSNHQSTGTFKNGSGSMSDDDASVCSKDGLKRWLRTPKIPHLTRPRPQQAAKGLFSHSTNDDDDSDDDDYSDNDEEHGSHDIEKTHDDANDIAVVSGIVCHLQDPRHQARMGSTPIPQSSIDKPLLLACFDRAGDLWDVRMVAETVEDAAKGWKSYLRAHPAPRPPVLFEQAESNIRAAMPEQVSYQYPAVSVVTEETLSRSLPRELATF